MSQKPTYNIDPELFEESITKASLIKFPHMSDKYKDEKRMLLRRFMDSLGLKYKSYYFWKYRRRLPADGLKILIDGGVENNFVLTE